MYQPCKLSISICIIRDKLRICCRFIAFYDAILATSGLAVAQVALMAEIRRSGGQSIDDLAAGVGMDRATLSHHLRPLLYNDAIEIVPSQNDGPVKHLKLTTNGERQLRHAEALWRDAQAKTLSGPGKAAVPSLFGAAIESTTTAHEGCDVAA